MDRSLNDTERRRYPRVFINLPLEYRDEGDSCLRGAVLVNAGEGGFLFESTRDIAVGTRLGVALLFSKGFELANLKAVTQIVWKEPYRKQDSKGNQHWKGYRYGVEFVQVLDEDRLKLNYLLENQFELEETSPSQACQL